MSHWQSHWQYLKYVLNHKRLVYKAGRELRVGRLQLILHDFQKFSPTEWNTYRRNFFTEEAVPYNEFQEAWLHHQKLGGKHHWQYWVHIQNNGHLLALEIPERYVREMLADWTAMGWAHGEPDSPKPWYEVNKDKMILAPNTRELLEHLLYLRDLNRELAARW